MSEANDNPAADPAAASDPQSPERLRAEIEHTQEQLGDTVEALARKTDVKAQASARIEAARESIQETVQGARESMTGARDELVSKVKQAAPASAGAGAGAGAGAQRVSATVQDKPLPFATAGAFAAGVLVGWLLARR